MFYYKDNYFAGDYKEKKRVTSKIINTCFPGKTI